MLGGPRSALEFYRNRGRGAVITASVLPPSCGRSQKNGFVSIVSARVGHHPPDLRAIMAGRKERAPSAGANAPGAPACGLRSTAELIRLPIDGGFCLPDSAFPAAVGL